MTERIYYLDGYLRRSVATIRDLIKIEDNVKQKIAVCLDKTIFYPGGGGQPPDKGKIIGNQFVIDVFDHKIENDKIWHIGYLEGKFPDLEERVSLEIDWTRRYDYMIQHSAQHILSATILKVLGAETSGFQIYDEWSKIEINTENIDWNKIKEIEIIANSVSKKSLRIYDNIVGENNLRMIIIEDYDASPCGGVHVKNSIEILPIKVIRFYKKTSKLTRLEFLAGDRAIHGINKILEDYWSSLDNMEKKQPPLQDRVNELNRKIIDMHRKNKEWKDKFKRLLMKYAANNSIDINGIRLSIIEEAIENIEEIDDKDLTVDFLLVLDNNKFALYSKNHLAKKIFQCIKTRSEIKGGGSEFSVVGSYLSADSLKEAILDCIRKVEI